MNRSITWIVLAGILILGVLQQLRGPGSTTTPTSSPTQTAKTSTSSLVIKNVTVRDLNGQVAYRGDVNLAPVFNRIQQGIRDPHRDDGTVFTNREGLLPRESGGYYLEYVVRTPGLSAVGPQRLIIGKGGEAYYTSDHYKTFTRVR